MNLLYVREENIRDQGDLLFVTTPGQINTMNRKSYTFASMLKVSYEPEKKKKNTCYFFFQELTFQNITQRKKRRNEQKYTETKMFSQGKIENKEGGMKISGNKQMESLVFHALKLTTKISVPLAYVTM